MRRVFATRTARRAERAAEASHSLEYVQATWALSRANLLLARRDAAHTGDAVSTHAESMVGYLRGEYAAKVDQAMVAMRQDTSSLALRPRDDRLLKSLLLMAAETTIGRTPISTASLDKSYWRV